MKRYRNEVGDQELKELIERYKDIARKNFKSVCVLMGGESEERDISIKTGKAISQALKMRGYKAIEAIYPSPIEIIKNADAVFIALHGRYGEDGAFQGLLEILKVPYTSPDHIVSALFMDKSLTRLIAPHILKHPRYEICFSPDDALEKSKHFDIPFVIKPSFSGSSFGISIIKNKHDLKDKIKTAFEYSSRVIIEEFLDGAELTVAVFESRPLGCLEIKPIQDEFFSFSAKYQGKAEYIIPPTIEDSAVEEALYTSQKICEIFHIRGAVRVDFKMKGDIIYFLELNTIPGMTEHSLYPKIAKWRNIDFPDMVEAILGTASLKINER